MKVRVLGHFVDKGTQHGQLCMNFSKISTTVYLLLLNYNQTQILKYGVVKVEAQLTPYFLVYQVIREQVLTTTVTTILSLLQYYTLLRVEYFGSSAKPGALFKSYTGSCVRSENFLNPTFPSNELDLTISSEVFEHIPGPYRALLQVHRVLKPSGMHTFTVPLSVFNVSDEYRAFLNDKGEIVFIGEPTTHGDPLSLAGGVPVLQTYGQETARSLCSMGFDVIVQDVQAPDIGVIGEGIIYFVTKKVHRSTTAESVYLNSLVAQSNSALSCFYNECLSVKKDTAVFKYESIELFPYTITKLSNKKAAYYLLLSDGMKHLVWDWDSLIGLGLHPLSTTVLDPKQFNSIPTGFDCERLQSRSVT